VASNDSSKPIDPADKGPVARRGRTAAEERQQGAPSNDPEVLTAEIERTREELAETLDAIADKVSPKRVAGRTKKKVSDAVKDGAEGAAETVRAGTAAVKEAAVGAKVAVEEKITGSPDPVPAVTAPLGGTSPTYPPATPPLRPVPPQSSSLLGAPALAGAVAAVVVALFVLRRRRR
jgi:MYXO-CTERM domain-containing protein